MEKNLTPVASAAGERRGVMECSVCHKHQTQGKVEKGKFNCVHCSAAAKRSAFENQIKERYNLLAKELNRVQGIMGVLSNNLFNLKEYLAENGIKVD
jgi:ribosomal protein L35AE/L33A